MQKFKKTWFLYTHRNQVFYIFINNSRSKQNKKSRSPFIDIVKYEGCTKYQQKILNSIEVGAPESFHFSDKIPGFSKIKELCVNSGIGFRISNA